jgi:hypothetical protein
MEKPHDAWTYSAATTPWSTPTPIACTAEVRERVVVGVSIAHRSAVLVVHVRSTLGADVFDENDAHAVAVQVVDWLAFGLDVALGDPLLKAFDLMSGRTMMTYDVATLEGQEAPDAAQMDALLGAGVLRDTSGTDLMLHIYREARTASDPIAAFLLYWNLLVMLHHGELEADAAVRTMAPDVRVASARRPRKGTVTEVLATRDDLAHMIRLAAAGDLSIPTLRTAVDDALPHLKAAVRKTVEQSHAL